jgi:hypothetical protein
MRVIPNRVQIHQYNDPEILEFFIKYEVEYRLAGDHLFIIRSRNSELAAGPGDWLVAGPSGEVEVERGDYALRAQRAISRAKFLRRARSKVVAQVR